MNHEPTKEELERERIYSLMANDADKGKTRRASVNERVLYYINQETIRNGGVTADAKKLSMAATCCTAAANSAVRFLRAEGYIECAYVKRPEGGRRLRRFKVTEAGLRHLSHLGLLSRVDNGKCDAII